MAGTSKNNSPGTSLRFILVWIIVLGGCNAYPAKDEAGEQERREASEEFSKKKACAEYGRAELDQLLKENESEDQYQIFVAANSTWCYNPKFNTCIAISQSRTFVIPLKGKAEQIGEGVWTIKDLLTNADIVSLSGKELEEHSLTEQFLATKEQLCPQFAAN